MQVQSLGQEDPLQEDMATHSNMLAWDIPWTEEPCGLQSIGSQRVRCDRAWACTHRHPGGGSNPDPESAQFSSQWAYGATAFLQTTWKQG